MRYSAGSIRHIRDDIWQARFTYYEDPDSFVETNEIIGTTGKQPTFYALRHTFATMLLQAGVDPKTVASLMGHTSVSMTLDVYACTDPKAKAAAGAVLSQVIAER